MCSCDQMSETTRIQQIPLHPSNPSPFSLISIIKPYSSPREKASHYLPLSDNLVVLYRSDVPRCKKMEIAPGWNHNRIY